MSLSGEEFRAIQDALLDAYDDFGLQKMVRFGLSDSLDRIASSGSLEQRIFTLVDWADRAGKVKDLIQAAYQGNQTNPALVELWAVWEHSDNRSKSSGTDGRVDRAVREPIFIDFVDISYESSFHISRYAVTNGEYAVFLKEAFGQDKNIYHTYPPNAPARVRWHDAVGYCRWVASLLRTEVRLPESHELKYTSYMTVPSSAKSPAEWVDGKPGWFCLTDQPDAPRWNVYTDEDDSSQHAFRVVARK